MKKKVMKIKFDSDDNLLLNKILKLHSLTIIVRSAFQEDNKQYPQFFQANVYMNYNITNINPNTKTVICYTYKWEVLKK